MARLHSGVSWSDHSPPRSHRLAHAVPLLANGLCRSQLAASVFLRRLFDRRPALSDCLTRPWCHRHARQCASAGPASRHHLRRPHHEHRPQRLGPGLPAVHQSGLAYPTADATLASTRGRRAGLRGGLEDNQPLCSHYDQFEDSTRSGIGGCMGSHATRPTAC
jgi:hypothetical protein